MFVDPDFTWNTNQPNISWRENTAGHKQSTRFPECSYDSFLMQMTKKPTRGGQSVESLTYKPGRTG